MSNTVRESNYENGVVQLLPYSLYRLRERETQPTFQILQLLRCSERALSLLNWKYPLRFRKITPFNTILIKSSQVHTFTTCFTNPKCNIIPQSRSLFSKRPISVAFFFLMESHRRVVLALNYVSVTSQRHMELWKNNATHFYLKWKTFFLLSFLAQPLST